MLDNNNKTPWTPGPWTISNIDHIDMVNVNAPSNSGYTNIVVNVLPNEYLDGDWRANAHLIAAAPDLYAVLEEISEMDALAGTIGKIKIKMALAKARGEQP